MDSSPQHSHRKQTVRISLPPRPRGPDSIRMPNPSATTTHEQVEQTGSLKQTVRISLPPRPRVSVYPYAAPLSPKISSWMRPEVSSTQSADLKNKTDNILSTFALRRTLTTASWIGANAVGVLAQWSPATMMFVNTLFALDLSYSMFPILREVRRLSEKEHKAAKQAKEITERHEKTLDEQKDALRKLRGEVEELRLEVEGIHRKKV